MKAGKLSSKRKGFRFVEMIEATEPVTRGGGLENHDRFDFGGEARSKELDVHDLHIHSTTKNKTGRVASRIRIVKKWGTSPCPRSRCLFPLVSSPARARTAPAPPHHSLPDPVASR